MNLGGELRYHRAAVNDQVKGAQMRSYTQLNQEQRYHISELDKAGYSQTQIAKEIGVHKSTIYESLSAIKGSVDGAQNRLNRCVMNANNHALMASNSL